MITLIPKIYFYLNSGVSIINDFRNLGLAIFALYFAMKLENPVWLLVMVIVCIPILIVMGYYNVHHISKVRERLSIQHGTHYGIQQFDLIKRQTELLEQILYAQEHTKKVSGRVRKGKL